MLVYIDHLEEEISFDSLLSILKVDEEILLKSIEFFSHFNYTIPIKVKRGKKFITPPDNQVSVNLNALIAVARNLMKRLAGLACGASLLAFGAGGAFAADLEPLPPVATWSGPYIGIGLGGYGSTNKLSLTDVGGVVVECRKLVAFGFRYLPYSWCSNDKEKRTRRPHLLAFWPYGREGWAILQRAHSAPQTRDYRND